MANQKLSNRKVIEAVTEHRGNLTAAARALKVARSTLYSHMEKHSDAGHALEEARETVLDDIESTLERRALEGHTAELIFFLKTRGKGRGYTEKQELEHSGQLPQQVVFLLPSNGRGDAIIPPLPGE